MQRTRLSRDVLSSAAKTDESGFTILEALIATAIVTLLAFCGLAACKILTHLMLESSATQSGADAIEAQSSQLENDAASAFAVFIPKFDMSGRPDSSRELDFYSKTDAGSAVFWRYYYDAPTQTLRRWDYDFNGVRGVRDVKTGIIDPAASYPALKEVTQFSAIAISADRLGDPTRNVYNGIASLFTRTPQALAVRFTSPPVDSPDVVGGNAVVQISLANRTAARVIHLAPGSMPTGFTVTHMPAWHAVVYRVDQSHRFWFGVAGKSHVFINAHVDVSYDGWNRKIPWCDFNLLGNPDGLDPQDPHADYKPDEPIEQSEYILAACRQRHPSPPARESPGNPPDADALHPPLPGPTAPSCWTQPGPDGRCWPADAPPDWTPPSPLPADTPPATWCATHALSPACSTSSVASKRPN